LVGGRHTHPGTLVARMIEGELTLEQEGKPTIALAAGDAVLIEPGQVHEGINTGDIPVRAIATFVVEKDKTLATQLR
jgi:quercetin dioxygenase-like cupin family protein